MPILQGRGPTFSPVLTVTLVAGSLLLWTLAPASGQVEHEFDPQADPDQPWAAADEPEPDSPEGRLLEVRRTLAEDRPRRARRLADRWLSDLPGHELTPRVRFLRGDARAATGNYYRALFDYEHVASEYPGTEQFHIALERQYEIASRYLAGMKRRLGPFRILPAYSESEETLIRIQQRAPGSEIGERAMFTLAEFYHNRGQMALASEAYDLFLLNYPRSQKRPVAMQRLVEVSVGQYRGPRYDASSLIEAQERLAAFKAEYPAAAEQFGAEGLSIRIEESLGLELYEQARWFQRRGEDFSAAYLYRRLIREHPGTAVAREAMDRLRDLGEPVPEPAEIEPRDEPQRWDQPWPAIPGDPQAEQHDEQAPPPNLQRPRGLRGDDDERNEQPPGGQRNRDATPADGRDSPREDATGVDD